MKWFHAIGKRIHHFVVAKERHGVHSPLVYQLMERDLNVSLPPSFHIIQEHRKELIKSKSVWEIKDFGAGSRVSNFKPLGDSVKIASSNTKKGAFLYRWCKRFQPHNILELGTHVGIGTAYLHLGNPLAKITTLEGDPFLSGHAQTFFKNHDWHIDARIGNFDDILLPTLEEKSTFDLFVIDGNHKGNAMRKYIEYILPFASENAWILLDDIHWSKDMSQAWQAIVEDPKFPLTLDFYQYGAVYLGNRKQKEHFVLKW
jgi:predicted O-methyltransferase YrrM